MKRFLSLAKWLIFFVLSALFSYSALDLIGDPQFYYRFLFVAFFFISLSSCFIFLDEFHSIWRDRRSEKEDK